MSVQFIATLVACLPLLTCACDPGMTIRQNLSHVENEPNRGVLVRVGTSHSFIGERWYAPVVRATNASDLPITITSVELALHDSTCSNEPRQASSYPLLLHPGDSEALDVRFHLSSNIKSAFMSAAELRVRYTSGSRKEVARVALVREH
jgi:hypothetical protein